MSPALATAHQQMATWLDSLLRQRADSVVVQSWNHVTVKGDTLQLRNFLARFNPSAQKRILFLAHWDSRPRADSPLSRDSTKPVLGANDGLVSNLCLVMGVAGASLENRIILVAGVAGIPQLRRMPSRILRLVTLSSTTRARRLDSRVWGTDP